MADRVEAMVESALVRGISWSSDGPWLSLTRGGLESDASPDAHDAVSRLPLTTGLWLRFSVQEGPRLCLGHSKVAGPLETTHVPCPTNSEAERGYQCGPCFAKDEFRYMHDFHRSGIGPAGLKAYLAQPHWLYIATFADGTTKVGTASQRSKWSRLAEQGALVARYVALAENGSVVRNLEDAVSSNLPPTQIVRGAAKFAALLNPRPPAHLEQTNEAMAAVVRDFVATLPGEGFAPVDEKWQRSEFSQEVATPSIRVAYPNALDHGQHGLKIGSMLGGYALCTVDGQDTQFLADLGALKGRRITLGDFTTDVPAVQESLF